LRLGTPEMPELLHPRMSDVCREKGRNLLQGRGERRGPHEHRGCRSCALIGMLSAARDSKEVARYGDLLVQIKRLQRDLNPDLEL
jgi:hypothetical protein